MGLIESLAEKQARFTYEEFGNVLENERSGVLENAMELYTNMIEDLAANHEGLSHPANFKEAFEIQMDKNIRVSKDDKSPSLHIPTIDSFEFTPELSVLRYMMEGFAGTLYELPEADVQKLLSLNSLPEEVERLIFSLEAMYGPGTEEALRFRLLPDTAALPLIEDVLGRKLQIFPFSEGGSIPYFEAVNQYVNDNMPAWKSEAITRAAKRLK